MPKIVDHDAQRIVLLDQAFELFADHGYAALSMRGLAKGIGVSTGTLYHYFDTKDAIFEQMVHRIAERDVAAALATLPSAATSDQKLTLISAWIRSEQRNLQRTLLLILDFGRHRADAEARELVRSASRHYRDALIRELGDHPGLWAMVVGAMVAALLEDEELGDPSLFLAPLLGTPASITT